MRALALLIGSVLVLAPGCRCDSQKAGADSAPSGTVAAPPSPPPATSGGPQPTPPPRNWTLPSGPVLAILAGQGVGPIRIGATVATIERHMALPCDVKTNEVCRYIGRGVEFQLENGVTKTVYVNRAGRPAGKDNLGRDAEYGFFNGAIPPDLQLGMVPSAIQEHLGAPKHIDRTDATGAADRVEVHHYDGMRIEYDRIENGNLVVGGIMIFKEPPAAAPSAK
jgi:hypothetical protein